MFDVFQYAPPYVWGALLAFTIAILRVRYNDPNAARRRVLLEAAICGCLSLTLSGSLEWLNAPQSASVALGGAVGFIGINKIRALALGWLGKKADKA